ncbi:MAG: T9SS type A sorting domain-containing protein [Bacteroidales bacterium]|nr:T9SS type A sorting domain-containing protein [Bacteroidales bacterium]
MQPKADFQYDNHVQDVQFRNLSTGAVNYQWFIDDTVLTGLHPFYRAAEQTIYSVQLVAASKFCGADTILKRVDTRIFSVDLLVNVYPVPTDGPLTIELRTDETVTLDISISDMQGKIYYQERIEAFRTFTRDLREAHDYIPSGIYNLEIRSGTYKNVSRIQFYNTKQ